MRAWFQKHRRRLSFAFILVFAGGGIRLFKGRIPHDVSLRFELPPTVRTDAGPLTRADMSQLLGVVRVDDRAAEEVGRFEIRNHWSGEAPLSRPVALRLREGGYTVDLWAGPEPSALRRAMAQAPPTLQGRFEVSGPGQVRVDVRAPQPSGAAGGEGSDR